MRRADSPHNRTGHTTGEQAGRRRGIAPDSEANGDKVAVQGAPSLALGMVILEVSKVSQVRSLLFFFYNWAELYKKFDDCKTILIQYRPTHYATVHI